MAKKGSNRILVILGVIAVALTAGAFIAKKAGWIGKEPVTEVVFAKAKKTDIIEKVSASGKVQPVVEVKISPDVSGEIIALNVEEGDSVIKGQLLLKIRPDNYESLLDRARASVNNNKAMFSQSRATLAQSEARLTRAKLAFERNEKLYGDKVISDSDFEQFRADYTVAKQDLEAARANGEAARFSVQSAEAALRDANENLRKTQIYAPESGTVSLLNVEQGERVVGTSQMAGTEILRIADLNEMEVRVNVNENDIVRVVLGDTAIIDVDAFTSLSKKFQGVVTSIANTANGAASSASAANTDAVTEFEVKIKILPQSYRDLVDGRKSSPFRPGMSASVEIITDRKSDALSVPIAAVTTRDPNAPPEIPAGDPQSTNAQTVSNQEKKPVRKEVPKEVVFVHNAGKVAMREVKTGISDFENIQVVSGLKEGDEVVSGPFLVVSKQLKEGDPVAQKDPKKDGAKKNEARPQ
ncbi:MAG: efflux RND transporter periplasmic adaptor subunit [Ferruginibacter sp.]|nr:efflux RND transporter periplasmic adaptor subunit [Cytophagales bacterium]